MQTAIDYQNRLKQAELTQTGDNSNMQIMLVQLQQSNENLKQQAEQNQARALAADLALEAERKEAKDQFDKMNRNRDQKISEQQKLLNTNSDSMAFSTSQMAAMFEKMEAFEDRLSHAGTTSPSGVKKPADDNNTARLSCGVGKPAEEPFKNIQKFLSILQERKV